MYYDMYYICNATYITYVMQHVLLNVYIATCITYVTQHICNAACITYVMQYVLHM